MRARFGQTPAADNLARLPGLKASMSGKGNGHDNAAAETLLETITAELIWRRIRATRRQAQTALFR